MGPSIAGGLSPEGKQRRDAFDRTLTERLKSLSADEARLPFDRNSGFDLEAAGLASTTRLDSEADALAWISRLKAFPRYYAGNIENARRGDANGPHAAGFDGRGRARPGQGRGGRPGGGRPLLKPFDASPLPQPRLGELGAEAATVIRDQIRPAQRAFVVFLETEYLPASRKAPAPHRR